MPLILPIALRFIVTGIVVNLTLYGLFAFLIYLTVEYRVAATVAYVLGVVWGYLQNRIWSWQSNTSVKRSFWRYFLVYALIYVLHITLISTLVDGFGVARLLAPLISAAALVVPLFHILDRFVFEKR
jgi:putative flippase GtrA